MTFLPVIIATLLTVTPAADNGTGTVTEYSYEPPYVEVVTEEMKGEIKWTD